MGDGVTTPFDVFVFTLIFVGIPALIFGFPIVFLSLLTAYRILQLNRKRTSNPRALADQDARHERGTDSAPGRFWILLPALLVVATAITLLLAAAPISRLLPS